MEQRSEFRTAAMASVKDLSLERVRLLATTFRRALEELRPALSGCGLNLERFPHGCCGNVSPILGAFLTDNGRGSFEMMEGHRGRHDDESFRSHAWLTQGALIVDITADQFDEVDEPVIVTRESAWHGTFEARVGCWGDYRRELDNPTAMAMGVVHRVVVQHLRSRERL